jgi:hypothetical protein
VGKLWAVVGIKIAPVKCRGLSSLFSFSFFSATSCPIYKYTDQANQSCTAQDCSTPHMPVRSDVCTRSDRSHRY